MSWMVHHKFAVIDMNGTNLVVIMGSNNHNWMVEEEQNYENTLIIRDAVVVQAYYREYLKLYQALPPETICSNHSVESGLAACRVGSTTIMTGMRMGRISTAGNRQWRLAQMGWITMGMGRWDWRIWIVM